MVKTSAAERSAKYRAKDIEAYRAKKNALTKTPHHRKMRREYMRVWRAENREKHNASARGSYQKHKHKHVQRNRELWLAREYGITEARYQEMLAAQNGVCALCDNPQNGRRPKLHVDHDHATGVIRGLLCSSCNGALGRYEKITYPRINEYLKRGKN